MSVSRWGKTATTWSPKTRLVASLPLVAIWLFLAWCVASLATAAQPVTALALVALGVYTMYVLPAVRYLWSANDGWTFSQAQQAARAYDVQTLAKRLPEPDVPSD